MKKNDVLLVTRNAHKLEEMRQMIHSSVSLLGLDSIDWKEEIEETGTTFQANARIKANTIFRTTKTPCLADDSGLVVPSLDGAPGVYSARYAGPASTDKKNLEFLLQRMEGISDREAYFVCHLHLIWNEQVKIDVEGRCYGTILESPRGNEGFGYDPIFLPEGYQKSMAELSPKEKNTISHRFKAVAQMNRKLPQLLAEDF